MVGFDDIPLAASAAFRLTTFSEPLDEIVDNTVSLLLDACSQRDQAAATRIVAGQLIVRDSARIRPSGLWRLDRRTVWLHSAAN